MNIHEYQAKDLLRKFGVPVLRGKVIFSPEEAGAAAYNEFVAQGVPVIVVKTQIHAGGRGKGYMHDVSTDERIMFNGKELRGVTVVHSGDLAHQAYDIARLTLGNKLVTIQTGAEGKIVRRMLIEEGAKIAKEFYCAILLDRDTSRNIVMVSTEGGMDIEEVAHSTPEKIKKIEIEPTIGFQQYQARELGYALGLEGPAFKNFVVFINKLVNAYDQLDCSMLEINPMVLTEDGQILALDAKVNLDENALFRHPELEKLRDIDEEEPLEVEAGKFNLNYIKLDGNVGCMVNGAGLAMGTMDIIQLAGGKPANFLDVGGGANVERIANAFRIMMSDENVKAVLINIFGGIVRCDRVANGIMQALQQVQVNVPLIVRLEGTNALEAKKILEESGLNFLVATTLENAAHKVTQALAHSNEAVTA